MDNVNLLSGDCLERMAEIPDGSVDMVLADPPYEVTRNKWDAIIPLEPMWENLTRVVKPTGAILLFGSGLFTARCMLTAPKGLWRYNLVWQKTTPTGFQNAKRMPMRAHEDIMVFYRKPPVYHPQKTTGHAPVHSYTKHTSDGSNYGAMRPGFSGGGSTERYPTSVWTFKTDKQKSALHPTQKPVALCEECLKTYSDPGDLVLDFSMGSGTTGVAAVKTGRRFIGIEIADDYFQVACARVLDAWREGDANEVRSHASPGSGHSVL